MMKKIVLCLIGILILLSGCTTHPAGETPQEEGGNQEKDSASRPFFNASSTYFDSITWEEKDNAYVVQGTVHLENDTNGIVTRVDAAEETTIQVTGTLDRVSGEIQLAYIAPDGTETLIADNEDGMLDSAVSVSEGKGTIQFTGEIAVCDFSLQFAFTDGVTYLFESKS